MQIQQTLIAEKLNHLTAILDDASEGFLTASIYARSKDQEHFFEKLSYQRKDFAGEIKKIVQSMGANSYTKGGFLSLLHRTWKDMTYQLKSKDRDAVKTCCVIGEKFASNYYESILIDPEIPGPVKNVLLLQLNSIRASMQEFEQPRKTEMDFEPVAETLAAAGQGLNIDYAEKKITFLIAYLQHISKDFEMIADEIEDKNLKNAFISLSEENSQFADQLNCLAKEHGLTRPGVDISAFWFKAEEENYDALMPLSKNNELMHICDKSEYLFLKLYSDALKEFLSFKNLKEMMIYQYNSIRAGFFKLRLLNSLRFNNDFSHI
jgi:uncharacterized protein (TIGR02284 family)